jgi:uncharacterized protein
MITTRLSRLPRAELGGVDLPVAVDRRSRLLGLALLEREQALPGLIIPDCCCVHTFGMRFDLDLRFLDRDLTLIGERIALPPRRLAWQRGAAFVLERPTPPRRGGAG